MDTMQTHAPLSVSNPQRVLVRKQTIQGGTR